MTKIKPLKIMNFQGFLLFFANKRGRKGAKLKNTIQRFYEFTLHILRSMGVYF